jgi:hypothetical protein
VASREAIATINRFVSAWLERNFRDAAALAASRLEHFTVAAAATAAAASVRLPSSFARGTAVPTAARLVREALHCEELLFAGREGELLSAVHASEHFV